MCHLFRRVFLYLFHSNLDSLMMPKPVFKTTSSKLTKSKKNTNRPGQLINEMNSAKIEVLPIPIKSDSDHKEYKVIRLENGLQALLISDMYSLKAELVTSTGDDGSEDDDSEASGSEDEINDSHVQDGESDNETEDGEEQEEKMAACALCVNVGSYSDPPDVQGLAHFVEHMVFMGSSKYPNENDFDSFIKTKGGMDNACTDCEVTNFHFEIPEEFLAEALDRFAQFFVSPLMKQEAMQRERESIQSEFALALPVDSHRRDQLLCMLLPKDHPGNTFMWGNHYSLSAPVGPEDAQLYQKAHEFRKRHYSAHRMTLAVQARLPLSVLEKYVTHIFSQIPSNSKPPQDFSKHQCNKNTITREFCSLYYVSPVRSKNELHLTWCMRSFLYEYKSKPHQYVSWILGHEGKGSLMSYLRKKVWSLSINTGNSESGIDHTSINSYFTISVGLTKEGLVNREKVIDSIFSYLNLLKKQCPDERIYKEIKDVDDISFKFENDVQPCDNVEGLAENMQLYPPEHYITGEELYYEYNPELIKYVLESLQPRTVNIMVFSQDLDPPIQYTETELWFGTKYRREEISEECIRRWENIEPHLEFHLPKPNIFIPDDFSLIPMPEDISKALDIIEEYRNLNQQGIEEALEEVSDKCLRRVMGKGSKSPRQGRKKKLAHKSSDKQCKVTQSEEDLEKIKLSSGVLKKYYEAPPELIKSDSLIEVWYKPDYKFRLPNALIYIHFMSACANKSAKLDSMIDIWCSAISQYLIEVLYPASLVDLVCDAYPSDRGITIKVGGFSQKLPVLVNVITKAIAEHTDHLTEEWFNAIKDQQLKSYNDSVLKPSRLSKLVRLSAIVKKYPNLLEKLLAVKDVKYNDMLTFSMKFTKMMKVRMLVQGNMTKEQALEVANTVQRNISWKELREEDRPKFQVIEIPVGRTFCRVKSMNAHGVNSNITNYYQWGNFDQKKNIVLEFLMLLMDEPIFDQLRTKEQLGYSVFSVMKYTFGILGFAITVNTEADKHSADHVENRITRFLDTYKEQINKLDDKLFEETKTALIKQKLITDITLKEETTRNWGEIISLEYQFDRLQQEIECAKSLTKEDIKEFFLEFHEKDKNDKFRLLSIQVIGNSESDASNKTNEDFSLKFLCDNNQERTFVCDINRFKENLKLFPEHIGMLPSEKI